ncbi:ribonuclease P protein component [Candidatus Kaiserbacteria bacterium RIFCSPHIGHO2_12_FULL_53_13]|uniref:Ribonuclease P protein component n=1 Tax=Candidatus Kaiserbacteria bacterium RIFCSPHIGHO2_12_FULL_53_13 TaxID=1798502 RepID=A0A1F6E8J6_9BACT|nr:MAG: ribonuclease P protein component [Candidatus Kaiserbacteria bacterium RIFCSPHIGHO2_12_FULL_53_13]OGG74403.1 MAG: ribonuclease P protein component [Candidatus Kaiserbacteria bacterium RIFCSPLOWO2_01_FULL_52_36]
MAIKQSISRSDFKLIEGANFRREHGALFSVSFGVLPSKNSSVTKAACVVSKKTAARATDRNLIKRRCREAARECLREVKLPLALIFYAKRAAHSASYAAVKEDIELLIKKVSGARK